MVKNKKRIEAPAKVAPESQDAIDVNEFIQSLPKDKQETAMQIMFAVEQSTSFRGPLPAPEDFKAYQEVLPDAPERILSMAEKQLNHRTDIEKTIVEKNLSLSNRGQWMGFILAILFLIASMILAFTGHELLSSIIMGSTLLGVLVVFVLNKLPWFNKGHENVLENIDDA
ncbi:Predicted membrane protein [Xylanibacter ruminicola]|uniref:Predicted membrane protein n=1 Tax=Xylanibacter ruminicola TaxID=839 RepID=A0A1H5RVG6_XYLRU|nr:DUF2335 domain-containing protein [Xylanibacter ruminicola]SEF42315.1 Predicted membrane protein [Xylanibacter ruminicola]